MRARTLAVVCALGISLAIQPDAHGGQWISIDSFSPTTVAAGDRVTITGDFSAIDHGTPRVFAVRDGVKRRVRLRVIEHDADTITAIVRNVPDPRANASDGAEWSLRVAAPGRRHRLRATADTPLFTSAPVIEDVRPRAIHPGWDLLVLARCTGKRAPRVVFGDDAVPSHRVRVERDVDGTGLCHVWARVPRRVGNGEHSVSLRSKLGLVVAAKRPKVAGCDDPPPPPPDLGDTVEMNANVKGTPGLDKKLKKGFVFAEFLFGNTVLIQGCFNEGANETCAQFVNLTIHYPEDGRHVGPVAVDTIAYTDSTNFGNGSGSGVNDLEWEAVGFQRTISAEIVESSSTRLKGTFRGTLFLSRGGEEQPAQVEIDGTFVIKR